MSSRLPSDPIGNPVISTTPNKATTPEISQAAMDSDDHSDVPPLEPVSPEVDDGYDADDIPDLIYPPFCTGDGGYGDSENLVPTT